MTNRWILPVTARVVFAAILSLGLVGNALAYEFSASGSADASYDDNSLRLPNGFPPGPGLKRGDILTTASGGFNLSEDIGLQQLYLAGSGGKVWRIYNSGYGTLFYDITGGAHWKIGTSCEGDAFNDDGRTQSSFEELPFVITNNVVRETITANGNCMLNRYLKVAGTLDAATVNNTSQSIGVSNRRELSTTLSFEYVSPIPSSLGIEIGQTARDYPNRNTVNNPTGVATSTEEIDASFLASRDLSPKTTLSGKAGIAIIHLSTSSGGQTSTTPTFDVGATWRPTVKLSFSLSYSRSIGASNELQSSYIIAQSAGLTGNWTFSSKLGASFSVSYDERNYNGSAQVFGFSTNRNDTGVTESLAAYYGLTEHIDLNANITHLDHSSNVFSGQFEDDSATLGATLRY